MVVPHRVMQTQRLVTLAPAIAGPFIFFDNNGRYVQHFQPGTEYDTALPSADNQTIGLLCVPHGLRFFLPLLCPVLATGLKAVLNPYRAAIVIGFLMAF